VGNGGIATELAYEIENCKIIWVIKDKHISNVFFDEYAAKFFMNHVNEKKAQVQDKLPPKRAIYTITSKT
jgi:pyridine nucleotide-disulfide oxidoreductase domain-containing protein 1